MKQAPLAVNASGHVSFVADVNCYYTITTVSGVSKPVLPAAKTVQDPRPAFFPLPFTEDFEGITAGGEAPYFGDQEGKWETVPAGGGRAGKASQQQLKLEPWPILEPQCNDHGTPVSIIGDMFFESVAVTADLLVEERGVGAALAARVRISSLPKNIRGVTPGVFLCLGATPGFVTAGGHGNPGGTTPAPNKPLPGWALCADSYCSVVLERGQMPAGSRSVVGHWHTVTLAVTNNTATGWIGNVRVFGNVSLTSTPVPAPRLAPPVRIPPSGWAGIAATIGRSQVDNFKLVGTAGGGAAVPPCGSAAPATGSPVVSTPCDYPGTVAGWTVVPGSGVIQLGLRRSIQANARPPLCLGAPPAKTSGHAGSAGAAVALVT